METEVLEEYTYYRIVSPRGVVSDKMTEREVDYSLEKGEFTRFLWLGEGDDAQAYGIKKYKVGKVYKYTRKTTLSEEIVWEN